MAWANERVENERTGSGQPVGCDTTGFDQPHRLKQFDLRLQAIKANRAASRCQAGARAGQ